MSEGRGTQRVLRVDWTACDRRGVCLELLPELLAADDWGYPLQRRADLTVRDGEAADAEEAVALCPRLALRLLKTVQT